MIIPKSAFYDDLELDQVLEEAIEGPVTALTTETVKAVGDAAVHALDFGNAMLAVKGTVGKSSISRMGKDSIQCFPAVFSSSIDLDDSIAIAKMLEKYYASLLVSIYSLRPAVSLKEYGDISQYLKSIHNNGNIPTNVMKAKSFIKGTESVEDTSIIASEAFADDAMIDKGLVSQCISAVNNFLSYLKGCKTKVQRLEDRIKDGQKNRDNVMFFIDSCNSELDMEIFETKELLIIDYDGHKKRIAALLSDGFEKYAESLKKKQRDLLNDIKNKKDPFESSRKYFDNCLKVIQTAVDDETIKLERDAFVIKNLSKVSAASEGFIGDRFTAMMNLFGVQSEQIPEGSVAPPGTLPPAKKKGGLFGNKNPWTKNRPADFKPNLSEAIKNTSAAIQKTRWAIGKLDEAYRRLDKSYVDACNAIRMGINLAAKDLKELEDGLRALNAMKSIGSNSDRIKDMSYSSNFKVIFDEQQLRGFCTAIEKFVEHYKNEAEYHIFNGKEENFATSVVGGMEGFKEFAEAGKKAGNALLRNIADMTYKPFKSIYCTPGKPVSVKKISVASVKKFTNEAAKLNEMAESKVKSLMKDCEQKKTPAEAEAMERLESCLGDIVVEKQKLQNGIRFLNSIDSTKKDVGKHFYSENDILVFNKDEADAFKNHVERNLAAIEKKHAQLIKPAIESFIEDNEFCLVDDEPSGLCVDANIFVSDDPDMAYEGLAVNWGALNMSSVNEISLPYKRTQHLLQERLEMAKATEADTTWNSVAVVGSNQSTMLTNKMKDNKFVPANMTSGVGPKTGQTLIEHNPTMINATFYLHGTGKDGSGGFTQQVNLGVKCMVRQENSDVVINSLVEGSKNSNPIFKFVSWSRGEYNLVKDFLFNIGEVKKKYKDKRNMGSSLLNMSKDRKKVDDVSKFAANRVLPYMTLIVTDYEVAQAAQMTGVDLTNPRNAKAFMDEYYLLGFGIYNSSTKKLSMMYDGDESFEILSMTYIQSQQKSTMNINKDFANLISMR